MKTTLAAILFAAFPAYASEPSLHTSAGITVHEHGSTAASMDLDIDDLAHHFDIGLRADAIAYPSASAEGQTFVRAHMPLLSGNMHDGSYHLHVGGSAHVSLFEESYTGYLGPVVKLSYQSPTLEMYSFNELLVSYGAQTQSIALQPFFMAGLRHTYGSLSDAPLKVGIDVEALLGTVPESTPGYARVVGLASAGPLILRAGPTWLTSHEGVSLGGTVLLGLEFDL